MKGGSASCTHTHTQSTHDGTACQEEGGKEKQSCETMRGEVLGWGQRTDRGGGELRMYLEPPNAVGIVYGSGCLYLAKIASP